MSNGYDEMSDQVVRSVAKPLPESALLPQRRFRDTVAPVGEASSGELPPWLRGRDDETATKKAKQKEGPDLLMPSYPPMSGTDHSEEECGGIEIKVKVEIPAAVLGGRG